MNTDKQQRLLTGAFQDADIAVEAIKSYLLNEKYPEDIVEGHRFEYVNHILKNGRRKMAVRVMLMMMAFVLTAT